MQRLPQGWGGYEYGMSRAHNNSSILPRLASIIKQERRARGGVSPICGQGRDVVR